MRFKVLSAEALYDSVQTSAGAVKNAKNLASRADFVRFFTTREVDGDPTEYTHGIPQLLALLNDKRFNTTPELVNALVRAKVSPEAGVEEVYLATLGRRPSKVEQEAMLGYIQRRGDLARGLSGVWWLLLNSEQFSLIP
jgi:hypothetical protein